MIPEGKVLLTKASVKKAPSEHAYELSTLMKQKPRGRGFGFSKPYLWMYMKLDSGRERKIKENLKRFIGEKPIYLDSVLTQTSAVQMHDYLINKGYFKSQVNYQIKYRKNFAKVKYLVDAGSPYKIRSVDYYVADRKLNRLIESSLSKAAIIKGEIYDSDLLILERDRLALLLNSYGYYRFTKNFIFFDVDTSFSVEKEVAVSVYIRNLTDSSIHKTYFIRDILIDPDYRFGNSTIPDTVSEGDYKFLKRDFSLNYEVLINHLRIKPGDLFNLINVRSTINHLSDIQLYKFIDIDFKEIPVPGSDTFYLSCFIRLTPEKRILITGAIETNTTEENKELIETRRYFGMEGNFSVINRNLFKRAVLWSTALGGSFDLQADSIKNLSIFGNYQLDLTSALYFPQAFLPAMVIKKLGQNTSKTAISAAYYFEDNIDYSRTSASLSYTYRFNFPFVRHYFTPIELSRINTDIQNDSFQKKLDDRNDPLLNSLFDRHLLTVLRWSWVYNDKGIHENHYWRLRVIMPETAGNIPWMFNRAFNKNHIFKPENPYFIGGVNFFQYLKMELDASYNTILDPWQKLAAHINIGMAFPFGNSRILPFEKRYFIGGANSIRAWPYGGLGPGSFSGAGATRFDRSGEFRFESNVEYRFDIFPVLEGAFFIDAGNIWMLSEDSAEKQLLAKDFIPELAVGSGFGFRFDFSYFILRLDLGFPVRNPALPLDKRWMFSELVNSPLLDVMRFNIGIGYPF